MKRSLNQKVLTNSYGGLLEGAGPTMTELSLTGLCRKFCGLIFGK